jgi:hypothetical protein
MRETSSLLTELPRKLLIIVVLTILLLCIAISAWRADLNALSYKQHVKKTVAVLSATQLGAPSTDNVEASIVAQILNTQQYSVVLAKIAREKSVRDWKPKEAQAIIAYYFALHDLERIENEVVTPLIVDRASIVKRLLVTEGRLVKQINQPTPAEDDQLRQQKIVADAILATLRNTVLVAGYLHERAGRRKIAERYYSFYATNAKALSNHFNYLRSKFAQNLFTVASFKLQALAVTLPSVRTDYANSSYFNMIIEQAAESVLMDKVFDPLRKKRLIGGHWDKSRMEQKTEGDSGEFVAYYVHEPERLAVLAKAVSIQEDSFLHFELCASVWGTDNVPDDQKAQLCSVDSLRAISSVSSSQAVAALAQFLLVRTLFFGRQTNADASASDRAVKEVTKELMGNSIPDGLKDDLAYFLYASNYQDNYDNGRVAFVNAFPYGEYDSTPAVLEFD